MGSPFTAARKGLGLADEPGVEPPAQPVERLRADQPRKPGEQLLLARAERTCRGEGEGEARVSLTVTYHAGVHQGPLDDLLRAEGHHTQHVTARDRPPWWAFWRYIGKVR